MFVCEYVCDMQKTSFISVCICMCVGARVCYMFVYKYVYVVCSHVCAWHMEVRSWWWVSCSIAFHIMFWQDLWLSLYYTNSAILTSLRLVPSPPCQCWDHWLLSSGDQTQVHACMTITNWTPSPQIQFYFLGTVQCCPKTNRKKCY